MNQLFHAEADSTMASLIDYKRPNVTITIPKVTPYYDSLVGKVIVHAATREEALRKMRAALCELVIEGIPTNIEEQLRFVEDERFISGNYDLTFMGNR